MLDLSTTTISVLLAGSLAAGWIDAVVGGGGLVLIPLLMIMAPQFPYPTVLAVNKVASVSGTASAAALMLRRIPAARPAIRYVPLGLAGGALGAGLATAINKDVLRPIIIVLLVAVGLFVSLRPRFGQQPATRKPGRRSWMAATLIIAGIAFYDGVFGPGTGLFLIMAITAVLGTSFLESAAWAKVINTSTNVGALVFLSWHGSVLWPLALALAVANVVGAQIGAHMALGRGTAFVRAVLLCVVVIMAGKLGADQLGISLNGH